MILLIQLRFKNKATLVAYLNSIMILLIPGGTHRELYQDPYLNSIMILLILRRNLNRAYRSEGFKFHYDSINSDL